MKISINARTMHMGSPNTDALIAPEFLLTEACILLAESRGCGQLLDGQFSTTGVLSGHMLESTGGVFQKHSLQSPIPKWVSNSGQGFNFNILGKKKKIPAWVYCATKAEIPYSRQSWEGLAPGWCGIWSSVGSELASFFRTSDSQASQLSGTLDLSLLPFFPMWKQGPWPRAQGRWGVAVKRAIPRPSKILPLREAWWVQTQVTLPAHRSLWTTTMKLRRKTRLSPVEEQNFCRLEQKLLRKHTFL